MPVTRMNSLKDPLVSGHRIRALDKDHCIATWDMVLIQRKEWGGGEVWFDGKLIRKDGIFLPADLKPLNPVNLK